MLHAAHYTYPTPTLVYMLHISFCTLLHIANCKLHATDYTLQHIIYHHILYRAQMFSHRVYCHCSVNIMYGFLEHGKQYPHHAAWYTLHTTLYCIHYTMMYARCLRCDTHYMLSYTPWYKILFMIDFFLQLFTLFKLCRKTSKYLLK